SKLESLEDLRIVSGSEVTDDGLAALRGLKNLRELTLGSTHVSGPGLAHLEPLVGLETLTFLGAYLNDDAAEPIANRKGLKTLSVQRPWLSPQAVAALQTKRPSLRITTRPAMPRSMPPRPAASPAKK